MFTRTATILALTIGLAAVPSHAQQPPQPIAQRGIPAEQPSSVLISVEFPGGTVAQYIDALKKSAAGKPVNIIASDRASKQTLSPISLKDVQVGVAANGISAAAISTTGFFRIEPISATNTSQFGGTVQSQWRPDDVSAYRVDFYPEFAGPGQEGVEVETFSVQRILRATPDGKAASPDVVLTAIETGLELQNAGTEHRPDLKFHADSGMLFVRGTKSDLRLVGSIISRMSDDAERLQAMTSRRATEEKQRGIATKEAQLDISQCELELQATEGAWKQIEQQVSAGTASQTELIRAQVERGRAQLNLERAKLNLERAQLLLPREAAESDSGPTRTIQKLDAENQELRKMLADQQAALKKLQPKMDAKNPK